MPVMLTRAELAAERAAYLKRQAKKRPAIGPAPAGVPMHQARGGRVRPIDVKRREPRIAECRACGEDFVQTHGKQRYCPEHRVDMKSHGTLRRPRHSTKPLTEAQLIQRMRTLADKVGRTPTKRDLLEAGYAHSAFRRVFGSIREAQIAAGLEPNNRGGDTTRRSA